MPCDDTTLPYLGQPKIKVVAQHWIEVRGISDHHFADSIYFRDPNGYVIELTAKQSGHDAHMNPAINGAREKLDRWQAAKTTTP
jgi:catechol-2,3-dioxygenase